MEPIHVERLTGCARCHGDGHDNLTFQPLTFPYEEEGGVVMTHWCLCPTNGEPILYGTVPVPEPFKCHYCGRTNPGGCEVLHGGCAWPR